MKKSAYNAQGCQFKTCDWKATSFFLMLLSMILITMILIHGHVRCRVNIEFVNEEIACEREHVIRKTGYAATQETIEDYIEEKRREGKVKEVAVYFRDLESGPIFGIEEFADFAPASLLKLPLAVVYMEEAEKNPSILSQMLSFTGSTKFEKELDNIEAIQPNVNYSVEDLIRRMLVYSDNNAYGLLYQHIENVGEYDLLNEAYLELGILTPNDPFDKVISVRRYASILRGLYNASLIDVDNSEKILSWLSESTFDKGLASGIPKEVKIADKYGERVTSEGNKQLHDCGVIYFPENPYLLCVMTTGTDYSDLEEVIKSISQIVYKEIDSRRL